MLATSYDWGKNQSKKNTHKGVSKLREFALVDHIFKMDVESQYNNVKFDFGIAFLCKTFTLEMQDITFLSRAV